MKPYYKVFHPLPAEKNNAVLKMFVLDMCTFVCGDMAKPDARCAASDDKEYGHIPPVSARDSKQRAEMIAWFQTEMETAGCRGEGPVRAWCVVVGHWPAFSFAGNGPTDRIIADLVPVMERAGVHAYFSGHDHNLQAIRKGSISFFVSGAGGYSLHPKLKDNIAEAAKGLNSGAKSVFRLIQRGFLAVRVAGDAMTVTAVDRQAMPLREVTVAYHAPSPDTAAPEVTDYKGQMLSVAMVEGWPRLVFNGGLAPWWILPAILLSCVCLFPQHTKVKKITSHDDWAPAGWEGPPPSSY